MYGDDSTWETSALPVQATVYLIHYYYYYYYYYLYYTTNNTSMSMSIIVLVMVHRIIRLEPSNSFFAFPLISLISYLSSPFSTSSFTLPIPPTLIQSHLYHLLNRSKTTTADLSLSGRIRGGRSAL